MCRNNHCLMKSFTENPLTVNILKKFFGIFSIDAIPKTSLIILETIIDDYTNTDKIQHYSAPLGLLTCDILYIFPPIYLGKISIVVCQSGLFAYDQCEYWRCRGLSCATVGCEDADITTKFDFSESVFVIFTTIKYVEATNFVQQVSDTDSLCSVFYIKPTFVDNTTYWKQSNVISLTRGDTKYVKYLSYTNKDDKMIKLLRYLSKIGKYPAIIFVGSGNKQSRSKKIKEITRKLIENGYSAVTMKHYRKFFTDTKQILVAHSTINCCSFFKPNIRVIIHFDFVPKSDPILNDHLMMLSLDDSLVKRATIFLDVSTGKNVKIETNLLDVTKEYKILYQTIKLCPRGTFDIIMNIINGRTDRYSYISTFGKLKDNHPHKWWLGLVDLLVEDGFIYKRPLSIGSSNSYYYELSESGYKSLQSKTRKIVSSTPIMINNFDFDPKMFSEVYNIITGIGGQLNIPWSVAEYCVINPNIVQSSSLYDRFYISEYQQKKINEFITHLLRGHCHNHKKHVDNVSDDNLKTMSCLDKVKILLDRGWNMSDIIKTCGIRQSKMNNIIEHLAKIDPKSFNYTQAGLTEHKEKRILSTIQSKFDGYYLDPDPVKACMKGDISILDIRLTIIKTQL